MIEWRHLHISLAIMLYFMSTVHGGFHLLRRFGQNEKKESEGYEYYEMITGVLLQVLISWMAVPYIFLKCGFKSPNLNSFYKYIFRRYHFFLYFSVSIILAIHAYRIIPIILLGLYFFLSRHSSIPCRMIYYRLYPSMKSLELLIETGKPVPVQPGYFCVLDFGSFLGFPLVSASFTIIHIQDNFLGINVG